MPEVMKGIYNIDLSEEGRLSLEAYLLDCGEGVVLVDTGMQPRDVDRIGAVLGEMGKEWGDIGLVFITHKHGDHINNLAKVKELTGASVMAGEGDITDIEKATGVKIDRGLKHGDQLEPCGIEVIHVPGHSEGNLCLYLPGYKAIIAGDTIFGDEEGNLQPPPERYCLDVEMAEREIRRLLSYDFDALLISHGKNILKNAKSKVEALCG